MRPDTDANVSRHLRDAARRHPVKRAVVLPSGASISFAQLDAECDRFAQRFAEAGLRPGMRAAVFVRPGFAFVPALFGCFRLGAIPVCIDPGMKLGHMIACVRESLPEAIIGIRPALMAARLFPRALASAHLRLAVPPVVAGVVPRAAFPARPTAESDVAAILFTSGSTGVPKGVVYSHGGFDAQQRLLRETYAIGPDEIDLVLFPLFALFSAAWGITAVIPRMDPARPARARGAELADLIQRHRVTHSAGSPAIWKNVAAACAARGTRLPTLRRILMAGAQVPEKLVRACSELAAEVHTPYGATEALPLTTITGSELLASYQRTRAGAGTCVGRPLAGVDIAILRCVDGPIARWQESLRQPAFARGEVAVRAAWVTREYFARPAATRRAKIPSDAGLWHRLGDVGYLDDEGRLWFCGRKDHRIFARAGILCPDPIEAVFDGLPGVTRSAVVGVGPRGAQKPVLVVEGRRRSRRQVAALLHLAARAEVAPGLEQVVFRKRFPVDARHNIKIDRLRLARLIEAGLR